ncbi:MAG: phosphoglucosamine mutase, partial [Candidatus Eremiobacteraeota bacterium]|nr:phosphoglucosamine mutase [Candidatus Eremiobacteraeota bacterium]
CEPLVVGVVPTPAVARIVRATQALAGVVISASHNPVEYNGIKFFASDGFKLTDERERAIEAAMERSDLLPRPSHGRVGIVRESHDLISTYFDALVGGGADLSALTMVVDAASGAAYSIGPRSLEALGATVEAMNARDDGSRINVECGSTDLRPLARRVCELASERGKAHVVGVAFDGDADRALFVDETGAIVDGDRTMLVLGREKKRLGTLAGDTVVGTVMSNIGLERALATNGIALARAAVGDRYVLETLRAGGFSFGGEQSGHVIDLDRNTTGDGPATAVALFSVVAASGERLHDLASDLHVAPQILVNVRAARETVDDRDVCDAIARVERELGETGRILVRASGTEPLVRVMIEGDNAELIHRLAHDVAQAVERATVSP